MSRWLSEAFPQARVQPGSAADTPERMDDSRLRELGLALRPVKETLVDMAAVLLALGLVSL